MELSSRIKDAVCYGKEFVSVTAEKAKSNKSLNNLRTKSLEALNAAVNSTSTYFSNLNQEVKTSMEEHRRHYDVIKADEPDSVTIDENAESTTAITTGVRSVVSDVRNNVIKLSKRQHNIVRLILRQEDRFTVRNNGEFSIANLHNEMFITAESLSKKYKVHARTIQRDLSLLQHIGLIEHVGSDKGGYWRTIRTNIQ